MQNTFFLYCIDEPKIMSYFDIFRHILCSKILLLLILFLILTSRNIKFDEDPVMTVWIICEVPDPVDRYSTFSRPTGLCLIEAYLQSLKFVALCVRTQSWLLRTDGQTDIDKYLRILRWLNVCKEPRLSGQYFYASHTYWQK